MKKMFRGIITALLGAAMLASLAACGSSGGGETAASTAAGNSGQASEGTAAASSEDVKVIRFYHRFPDEPYNSFIEEKLHEYEVSHPDIRFEITSAQNQDYKEKIKIVVGGEDTPDIFFSWAGDFTERFIRENLILDLKPYMEADPAWKDSLIESQIKIYTDKNGMVYGIPFRLDAKVFFYNADILEEHGIAVPKNWEEFTAACETLKTAGITPIAFGNQQNWASAHYVGTLNQIFVPDEVRAVDYNPSSGAFTDPGYVTALEYFQKLFPYMNDTPNAVIPDMSRTNFVMGQAAFYYAELIEIPYITADDPELNFGMFKFPEVKDAPGNQDILTGAPEGFVVSSKTKYPDECVEFLKWFLGTEVGKEQCQRIGWFNASKGTTEGLTDQKLLDAYNIIMEAAEMAPWLDSALYSTVTDEYLTATSDLINGNITPEEQMARIQEKAKEAQTLVGTTSSGG